MYGFERRNILSGLYVYFTGSPRAVLWRDAISTLAHQHGWCVAEDDGSEDLIERLGSDRPLLILSSLATPSRFVWDGLQVVVVKDTPAAAVQALALDRSRQAKLHAAYNGSTLFAQAADMVAGGAIVLDADASTLLLPMLGRVAVASDVDTRSLVEVWHSLDIYRALPPTLGASALWPLDAFKYPVMTPEGQLDLGGAVIDLTGRARTLVYGPYTHLSPGLWEVEVKVLVEPDGGGAQLRFEWGCNPDYVGTSASIARTGVYRICLQRAWQAVGPSEMRVTTIQPHFHGRFELISVEVRLVSGLSPDGAEMSNGMDC